MAPTYKHVSFEFHSALWAETIADALRLHGVEVIAELLDMTPQGLEAWGEDRWTENYRYPRMTNFLKVVNLLDLNPAHFFTTSE